MTFGAYKHKFDRGGKAVAPVKNKSINELQDEIPHTCPHIMD